MTDRNNAQPSRHGVIKRTIGDSLARSWPPPLPPRRCCVPLLPLLGLSAAAANNRCAVAAFFAVCRVLRLSFTFFVCARLVRSRTSTRSHQGTESSNGQLKASSLGAGRPRCRAAVATACCCYYCWACLLLLPIVIIVVLLFLPLLCARVDCFVYICVYAIAYVWSFLA